MGSVGILRAGTVPACIALLAATACQRVDTSAVKQFADATASMTSSTDQGLTRISSLEWRFAQQTALVRYLRPSRPEVVSTRAAVAVSQPTLTEGEMPVPLGAASVSSAVRKALGNTLDLLTKYAEHLSFLSGDKAVPPTQAAVRGATSQASTSLQALAGKNELGITKQEADGVAALVGALASYVIDARVQAGLQQAVLSNREAIKSIGEFSRRVLVGDDRGGLALLVQNMIEDTSAQRAEVARQVRRDVRVTAYERYLLYQQLGDQERDDAAVARIPGTIARAFDDMVKAHEALAEPAVAGPSVGDFAAAVGRLAAAVNESGLGK